MSYRITWEGCVPRIKRAFLLEKATEPREAAHVTVEDALLEVVVVFAGAPRTLGKRLEARPWRGRYGDVELGYPARMQVADFFSQWKVHGAAEVGGMVVRWEDFQFARVQYVSREVTLP